MKKFCLLLMVISQCAFGAEGINGVVSWDVISAAPARIAAPKGWRSFDGIPPAMLIYRQGDGVGVPTVDETGAPVQIGLTVERFPPDDKDTDSIAKEIAQGATRNPDLKMVGQEKTEVIVLSDRTKATLVSTGFIKAASRRSFYMKLVAKSDSGDVWVATGYIVAGRESEWSTPEGPLARWLRAHVLSLTVTGKDVEPAPLEAAYRARDEKQELAPSFDLTGKWSGAWRESGRESAGAFTMELRQTGAIVTGTAIFMDSTRTTVTVSGEATGSKVQLVMTSAQPSIPATTWIGTVADQGIVGNWYLRGRGASSGSWTAAAETKAAKTVPDARP